MDVFVQVAEVGSFSQAARRLRVSKAHVSRQISRLEERLGQQLVLRTTRRVSLTELGQIFYSKIKGELEQLEAAENAIMSAGSRPRGWLRISVAGAYGERYVVPAAIEFMKRYPDVEVDLQFTERNVDLLVEGIDLAIRSGKLEDSSLIARRITSRKLKICASPDYFERKGVPDTPEQLSEFDCLQGSTPYWYIKGQGSNSDRLAIKSRWKSNNGHALCQAAINGMGITQLPEFYVEKALRQGLLSTCLDNYQPTDNGIWAVYPNNKHLATKVRLFVDFLVEKNRVE
nr:LysR family transcriptional regulator [Pleionea sp. CnH1-48]